MKEKIIGIYKITSPTGRIYIGQSVDCIERKRKYRYGSKVQRLLHRSILKYGWVTHIFEVIHVCEREELNTLEKHYIELFETFNNKHGLNLREGGNVSKMSDETREKMRLANLGKKHTEATRKKLSDSHKGQIAWNKGIARTEEEKKSHSDKMKGHVAWNKGLTGVYSNDVIEQMRMRNTGLKRSAETKRKMSEARKGEKHYLFNKSPSQETINKMSQSKSKIIIDLNTGVFYIGVKEAAELLGVSRGNLYKKLNGRIHNDTGLMYTY